jgi:16S rRNA C967 or C1407 C5-methylase (RsmB/RsmF family)
MNIDEFMGQPRSDDVVLVQLRERCSTEAFQMWLDAKMPGWKVKRVLADAPCSIRIVVEKKADGA